MLMSYRATQHSSTGFTPNKLFLGRKVKAPIDVVLRLPAEDKEYSPRYDDYVERQQQTAHRSFALVREHLRRAAERRKTAYDSRVKKQQFYLNTRVWYYSPRKYTNRSPKLQSCYTRSFLITRLIPPLNCVIQRSPHSKPLVMHYDKIKPVLGDTPRSWLGTGDSPHASRQPTPTAAAHTLRLINPFRSQLMRDITHLIRRSGVR